MMNIKSIVLEHTNPSLGPHETVTEVTLSVSKANTEKVNRLINQVQVNQVVSLDEYVQAVNNQEAEVLEEVSKNAPKTILSTGATISNLYLYFEDAPSVKLYDVYRRFNLSHFNPELTSYMVKTGTISHHKPFFGLGDDDLI